MKAADKEDSNCVDDAFDVMFEHVAWFIGWIEGCVVGFFIGRETHHRRHRPDHDLGVESLQGFERGCANGMWFGEHS
jgi:hypothetical protein